MLNDQTLHEFEEKLVARRHEILDWRKSFRTSWQNLSEQERELEESASKEKMARDLERLDHRQYQEIVKIDEAMARIETGEFGLCTSCGEPISLGRLNAIPWARECVECAEQRESFDESAPLTQAEQVQEGDLNDEEICEAIWSAISGNEGVDSDGLKIACDEGVVQVTGVLPTPSQHQAVMEIIHEEFGIDDVIDQVEITESGWVEETDTDENEDVDEQEKQTAIDGEKGEVDPNASIHGDEPMVPPDRFIPEEER